VIFVDEANQQNDGNFKPIRISAGMFGDIPAWWHNTKAVFGFFDNHVDLRSSQDAHIMDHNDPCWYPTDNETEHEQII